MFGISPNMLLTSILFYDKLFARARKIQLRFGRKMSKIFYKLGKMTGPNVRKAKWLWQTATNSQAEAIKAEYEDSNGMETQILNEQVDLETRGNHFIFWWKPMG